MIFYYILIVSLPLVSHRVFGFPIGPFTVEKYLGMFCLIYALSYLAVRRSPPRLLSTGQARAFLFFFLLATASHFTMGTQPTVRSMFLIYFSQALFFLTTLGVVDSVERLRRVLLVTVGSITFASLYVLREWQGGSATYGADYRPGYVTGDSNFFSMSAVLCVPLVFYLILQAGRRSDRIFWLGCLLVITAAIMVAASRGGFLALLAAMIWFAWHSNRRTRNFFLVGGVVACIVLLSPLSALDRLVHPTKDDRNATDARLVIWKGGLRMILENPVMGIGLGNFKETVGFYAKAEEMPEGELVWRQAHNTYIEIAAEMGVPGLLCFLAILLLTFRSLSRVRRQTERSGPAFVHIAAKGIQAGLLGFALGAFFVSTQFLKMFWFMLFLSMCLPQLVASEKSLASTEQSAQPGKLRLRASDGAGRGQHALPA